MEHTEKRCNMENNAETKIKQDLLAEIQNLEHNYEIIRNFTAGIEYDVTVIGSSIQSFKDSLSRASAFVLALYNLKGKRVNIPWDPLFTNLDYALATLSAAPKKASCPSNPIDVRSPDATSHVLLRSAKRITQVSPKRKA